MTGLNITALRYTLTFVVGLGVGYYAALEKPQVNDQQQARSTTLKQGGKKDVSKSYLDTDAELMAASSGPGDKAQTEKASVDEGLKAAGKERKPDVGFTGQPRDSQANSFVADFINFTASQLPQETLLSLFENSTPFGQDELQQMSNPVEFIARVTQLATGTDLGYRQSEVSYQKTTPSFLVDKEFKEGENLTVVSPMTTRIFMHFQLPGYVGNDVLVKWYYSDTNKVLSFKRYPINPADQTHYVWLDNQEGWMPGNYFVEVYSTDEALTILSSGNYYVSN